MKKDNTNQEEKINSDLMNCYFKEQKKVHIILKRKTNVGDHVWMNGYVTKPITDRVWLIAEDKLGDVRISISEIKSVEEYEVKENERGEKW